jgi:hypothetical protein
MSEKQIALFKMIESEGELVFACGPRGVVANIVGHFKVQKNHHDEDQLDMGDGTNHVHIDWARIKRFEVSFFHGGGLLIFLTMMNHFFVCIVYQDLTATKSLECQAY